MTAVLVHLASGVGNVVLATPLLKALAMGGYEVDVLVDGDYPETAELLAGWSLLGAVLNGAAGERPERDYAWRVPAIPPFYWRRYAQAYAGLERVVRRPPDRLFYTDEQAYYLAFARALHCGHCATPGYALPRPTGDSFEVGASTLVLAPGCKTGEMASKRWPYFAELAEAFDDVVVVGVPDDLLHFDGTAMRFPAHARSLNGRLTLRQTAAAMAGAGAVVANDSGLGHLAGALGVPTVMIFGPTPDRALGRLPPNVRVLRSGLGCQPCWFAARHQACARRIDCLAQLSVETVAAAVPSLSRRALA